MVLFLKQAIKRIVSNNSSTDTPGVFFSPAEIKFSSNPFVRAFIEGRQGDYEVL